MLYRHERNEKFLLKKKNAQDVYDNKRHTCAKQIKIEKSK